ncbi:hypothetical protein [Pandoraea apista]|uniref:Uncharacterized protein n=1 Tax=Pandoraea apista TaxID=93218 RepID=A0ABX9ZHI8_9BURK|nr:hypothetical protein [Pandoraea apista]PTE02684.1 hypothetical protein C7830_00205 [Pandoraea apista]RRJ27554.1 hypothetical protein EIB05_21585 [Pandoraea apista]RRJ73155.1 hypothetical protein EIL82_21980 [Pandoraea apista]RSD06466.1 hypothetical protein EJB12_21570 [Pandoraea apista]RSD11291.1 hypothetical protein EIZ52_21575 [Pandoraea apista]
MADKHTPGPWDTNGLRIWAKVAYSDSQALELATMSHFVPCTEREATARLTAAAPELLEALEQIERLSRTADAKLVNVRAMLGDIARAALSKARGEHHG